MSVFFSGRPWIGAGALAPDKHSKDIEHLDNYAKERWEVGKHDILSHASGAVRHARSSRGRGTQNPMMDRDLKVEFHLPRHFWPYLPH